MRIGSLFSGIGGLDLGLEWSGIGHTVWQVERDEYCRSVLARHWPDAEQFDDVCTVGASTLSPVDLICGGFPCQNLSSAGKGEGLAGSRSGLWFEYLRIVSELRPEWVVVENVASGAPKWVDTVRAGLGQLGYETIPFPLSASDVGAPHERARIFIVAHTNSKQLREQQGWGAGASRKREAEPAHDGEAWHVGDSHGDSQPALTEHGEVAKLQRVASCAPGWSAPPEFRRVDDGIPDRVQRIKALGNAVVPACSEVIGHIIRQLIEAQQ